MLFTFYCVLLIGPLWGHPTSKRMSQYGLIVVTSWLTIGLQLQMNNVQIGPYRAKSNKAHSSESVSIVVTMFNEHRVCPMLTLFKIFPSKYIWDVFDCLRDLILQRQWKFFPLPCGSFQGLRPPATAGAAGPQTRLSLLQARWSGTHYRLSFAICLSVLMFFGALLRRYYSRDIMHPAQQRCIHDIALYKFPISIYLISYKNLCIFDRGCIRTLYPLFVYATGHKPMQLQQCLILNNVHYLYE